MQVEARPLHRPDDLTPVVEPLGQSAQQRQETVRPGLGPPRGRSAVHHPYLFQRRVARAGCRKGDLAPEGMTDDDRLRGLESQDQGIHIAGAGGHGVRRGQSLAVAVESQVHQHDPPVGSHLDDPPAYRGPVPASAQEAMQKQDPPARDRPGSVDPTVRQ